MDFEKYADFSLDFKLLFYDNNEYISPNGKSFRDLMEEGKANYENFSFIYRQFY